MAKFRIERDTMGDIEVPAERLWGAQTQRSVMHFYFPGEDMPQEAVYAQVPAGSRGGRTSSSTTPR